MTTTLRARLGVLFSVLSVIIVAVVELAIISEALAVDADRAATWLRTLSTAAAAAIVTLRLARRRTRASAHSPAGGLDVAAVAVGGLLVGLVLIGLVLGLTHIGIDTDSWIVAAGVVAVTALVVDTRRCVREALHTPPPEKVSPHEMRPGTKTPRAVRARDIGWFAAAAAVIVVALVISTRAANTADRQPLELSVLGTPAKPTLVLSTGLTSDPLQLTISIDNVPMTSKVFVLRPGIPMTFPVTARPGATISAQLFDATTHATLRTVKVQDT